MRLWSIVQVMHVILNKFNWIWRFDRNGLIKHEARRAQNVMKWLRSQQNICGIMHNALMRRQSTHGIRWCLTCKIGFHRCGFIHILFHNNRHRHYTPWKENWAWITAKQVNEQNSAANNNKRFVCRINDYRYTFINSIHMLHAKKHHFSVTLLPINCNLVKRCFRCTKIHVCLRLRKKLWAERFRLEHFERHSFCHCSTFQSKRIWREKIVKPSSLISTKLTVLNGNFIDKSAGNLFLRCLGRVVRIVRIILFIACAVPLID